MLKLVPKNPEKFPEAVSPEADKVRIAIPKKGRLSVAFNTLLKNAGLNVVKESERLDYGTMEGMGESAESLDVEVLSMAGRDALRAMSAGITQMAIVGRDTLGEFNACNENILGNCEVTPLGFGQCALWIASPSAKGEMTRLDDLRGMRIATSYPGILEAFLVANNIGDALVVPWDGGVEDTIRLGVADLVCDLVETGTTLEANGLVKRLCILESEAVLVENTVTPRTARQENTSAAIRARLCNGMAPA